MPIFEVAPCDHGIADASGYRQLRIGLPHLITCPRAFGDRFEWPRRWDLEILRRQRTTHR